jgi:hypothetical protein
MLATLPFTNMLHVLFFFSSVLGQRDSALFRRRMNHWEAQGAEGDLEAGDFVVGAALFHGGKLRGII